MTRDMFTSYDILGRQLTARFDSQAGADGITNAYDGFGNLASSTIAMAGFSKAVTALYDADNNRTRVTHPDGLKAQGGGVTTIESLGASPPSNR